MFAQIISLLVLFSSSLLFGNNEKLGVGEVRDVLAKIKCVNVGDVNCFSKAVCSGEKDSKNDDKTTEACRKNGEGQLSFGSSSDEVGKEKTNALILDLEDPQLEINDIDPGATEATVRMVGEDGLNGLAVTVLDGKKSRGEGSQIALDGVDLEQPTDLRKGRQLSNGKRKSPGEKSKQETN